MSLIKSYTIDEAEDLLIGEKGSQEREEYEFELKLGILGDMIKSVRKKKSLTQEQLGQISRIENNSGNVTVATVLRIFDALGAKMDFRVRV